jgi:ferredoxin-like protein FixX
VNAAINWLVAGEEYRVTLACGHTQTYRATGDGQTHLGRAHCWECGTRETITDFQWAAGGDT